MDNQQPEPGRPTPTPHPHHPAAEQQATIKSRYAVPPSTLFAGALVTSTEVIQLQPDTPADWSIDVGGAGDGD
jgi:hypothetical protein